MSMKANDLMVGDYISVKPSGMPIKVAAVHHKKVAYHAVVNKLAWVRESLLEPIPLTLETLEKNRFVIKKKWAQIGNFGDSPLIMWHFEDNVVLGDFKHELEIHQNDTGKVHVRIPCEYVHQLQHALKLCGIEKEIIL